MNDDKRHIISIGKVDIDMKQKGGDPDPDNCPLLITRDLVLFPGVVFPISLGRKPSIAIAEKASESHTPIGVVCQRDPALDNPRTGSDIYDVGVTAYVLNVFDLPDGSKTAIVQAGRKFHIESVSDTGSGIPGVLSARIKYIRESRPRVTDKEFLAVTKLIAETVKKILRSTSDTPGDLAMNIENLDDPVAVVNLVATHSPFDTETKIALLSRTRVKDRAMALLAELSKSEQMADIMDDVRKRTKQVIDQQQRNAFLQSQMEAIREELYGDENDDVSTLTKRGEETPFPPEVASLFKKEVAKLSRLNPSSPDYSVQFSYLDTLLELPWGNPDPISTDFGRAEEILDADHYGLEKVKERVLEQLAVMMHTPEGRSPIICLVGAPGVGKTSLGQSIASALGRKYRRVSLGGLHDEAEIRGHRRTYIGAMPGRIIDAMRRSGSSNPLLLLDEIDKVGKDFRGDPSAALLEVLDPEQNIRFHDNYVDVDYDLSKVLFIATANTLSTVPQPLIDRMEVIEMPGYLLEEKVEIARRHLIPRALRDNGFNTDEIVFDNDAIVRIIENYTAESGVRQLEKEIASVIRKIVLEKMRHGQLLGHVGADDIRRMLGVEKFTRDRYEADQIAGVATGLAWTAVGGEILFIESSLSAGKGEKLTLTGNLGDVMKESAMIALQYVRSHAADFGIDPKAFDDHTLHIHVPEGAIPKDGPSAGITMATSIISVATGRPVKSRLAMTGEITLRGKVLPVGGIKEKILAAKRAGVTEIILSRENRKDIEDIRPDYLTGLTFHYVTNVGEVMDLSLV